MQPSFNIEQTISRLCREEWGRILSSIASSAPNLQLAEDCLQDAVEKALKDWPKNGLPDAPAAWLISVARRGAIDRIRRDQNFASKQAAIQYETELRLMEENELAHEENQNSIPDKRLEMMFVCCHPAIEEKSRVALTLRIMGGLKTEEIAASFLDKPSAMSARLTRAKKKIQDTKIPIALPPDDMIADRVSGVLSVIYLIFNEGYSASTGANLYRRHLSDEAIRLARIMKKLMPDHTEVTGLLALMLLHDSRRRARIDSNGAMVALEHQDRDIWNRIRINEGVTLIKKALPKGQVGPYQIQAAISAIHSEAKDWQSTDWAQIVALYELLLSMDPNPVIAINHAIAVSYANDPMDGFALLKAIQSDQVLTYKPFMLAMAHVTLRMGHHTASLQWLEKSLANCDNEIERAFIQKKLDRQVLDRQVLDRQVNADSFKH